MTGVNPVAATPGIVVVNGLPPRSLWPRALSGAGTSVLDLFETESQPPQAELLATSTELDEWLRGCVVASDDASVDALLEAIERSPCDMRFVPEGFGLAVIDTP